jgi:hypothetical protein
MASRDVDVVEEPGEEGEWIHRWRGERGQWHDEWGAETVMKGEGGLRLV